MDVLSKSSDVVNAKLRGLWGLWSLGLVCCFTWLPLAVRGAESAEDLLERARLAGESHKDSAIILLLKAAELFALANDFDTQAKTFNEIGNTYLQLGNESKAIEYYIASAETYSERAGNRQMYGRNLINIALVKLNIGDPDQALDYARQGLAIAHEFDDEPAIVFTQRLMGRIYRSQGLHDEAIAQIKQTLRFYREQQDWANLGESFQNIANNFFDKREFEQAVAYSDSSMRYNRKANHRLNLAYSMHSLSFTLIQLNRLEEAKAYSDSSIAAGKALSNPYLVLYGYRVNADIMRMKRDIDGYGNYMALYLAQRDSLDQLQQVHVTRELEAKYQNQVKQAEIELLLLEQQLMASNLRRQKNTQYGISFTLLVVLVFSGVLVNRFRVLNATRRQLEVEKLRNSIARDLHDDLGSTLSSVNILSRMALQNPSADTHTSFERIAHHTHLMMDKLSDIVWSLHPDHDSLEQMLIKMREFANEILEPQGIKWKLRVQADICGLRPSLEQRKAVFLIFKESLNNIAKYSEASEVEISLQKHDGQLALRIADRGKGFVPEKATRGNGLRNMQERAKMAGGILHIISNPGAGAEVLLKMPIT